MRRTLILLAVAASHISVARAEVPVSYAATGHPTVPTYVNGKGPYPFVFDTGAEGTAIYSAFAQRVGLAPLEDRSEVLQGQTGAASLDLTLVDELSVDGRTATDVEAVILPDRADGIPLNGIVGLDIMGGSVVEFDVPGNRVVLHPRDTQAAGLVQGPARRIEATRLTGGLLGIPVRIRGAEGIAVLDSGARDTRINWRFAAAAGVDPDWPGLTDDGVIQGATNNPVAAKRGDVGVIELGDIRKEGQSLRIVDLPVFEAFGVADRPAMILGMDLLKDAHLIVDFPLAAVWLVSKRNQAEDVSRR